MLSTKLQFPAPLIAPPIEKMGQNQEFPMPLVGLGLAAAGAATRGTRLLSLESALNLCPACRSKDIHRSKSRNALERWRKEHSDKRLFRCHKCGWRGWGIPLGSDYHPPVEENAVDVEQIRFDVESPDRDTKDR